MTVLRTHEGKRLLCTALQVCAVLCEPEMPFLKQIRYKSILCFFLRFRCILFIFLQIVIICVFGDLTKPHSQVTVASEIVDFFQGFEECFLCEFLCDMGIMRKRKQITVYDGEILFVYLLNIHIYDDVCIRNVTKNLTKEKGIPIYGTPFSLL